jgi:hypothetical protein
VAAFFAVFVVCFSLLSWPWPRLKQSYASGYRSAAGWLLPTFGKFGRCEYVPVGNPNADTQVTLVNIRTATRGGFLINTRFMGYVPTVLTFSLIVATPVAWRRRAWSLLWGMLAVNVFVWARLALSVLHGFCGPSGERPLSLFSPGPILATVLEFVYFVFAVSSPGHVVVPLFLWVAVTFRHKDWETLLHRSAGGAAAVPIHSRN